MCTIADDCARVVASRLEPPFLECVKGAEKASCGETVVQKGVFGESVSCLPPCSLLSKRPKNLRINGKMLLSILAFWMTVSPHDAFSAPSAHPPGLSQNEF